MMTPQRRIVQRRVFRADWSAARVLAWKAGLSSALLAAWITGASPVVSAGDPRNGGYGSGNSDSLEDEVGSLPTVRDDGYHRVDDAQDGAAQALPLDASLVLTGPAPVLRMLVADAHGTGFVHIETTSPSAERWTFHGEPTVLLDRAILALGLVDVQVEIGLRFAGGAASVEWDGGRTAPRLLPPFGDLDLPVGRLAASGALDTRPATFRMVGPLGARASLGLRASAQHLAIVQRLE